MVTVPDVASQLDGRAYRLLVRLVARLASKRRRNLRRAHYYDSRNAFRDLRIAVPPQLRDLEVALGWPAKAVDMLARRVRMDGFVLPGGDLDAWGIGELVADNRVDALSEQATTSALIHSVAFILTFPHDADGVRLTLHPATHATGTWGVRGLADGLVLLDEARDGATGVVEPSRWLLLTPERAWELSRVGGTRRWAVQEFENGLGRVPVEPLVYRPRLGRPFGSSRISRAVMAITDSALRTVVRSEVGAEFFSAPQRYVLGADEDQFVDASGKPRQLWDLVMGRMLMLERATDVDGAAVQIGQFPQISMQPHTDQLRQWATLFAAETGLPVSALGVVSDNPSSAEAIYAAKEDLVIEAEATARGFTGAWCRAVATAVQLRDGVAEVPSPLRGLGIRWADPSTPSRAQATDAVMKQIAAGVLPADSDVALEQLGYDQVTIQRLRAHRAASPTAGADLLAAALSRQTSGVNAAGS